ncbi:MotE family protein [Falsiroseomonas selenitidurans]|uniref:Magnesium transporter MgtE intracellular domain-containing protein n=1 Tax=Falsiroseomonas selenitidurans TaxID=2716335 RepID=A0ABX1E853_9PROT|nr:hypothetical protein [Falsiroseomonas selenitidurans]NKC31687.1 hypothetical protein [Falsiroseomonas selenitidurans]
MKAMLTMRAMLLLAVALLLLQAASLGSQLPGLSAGLLPAPALAADPAPAPTAAPAPAAAEPATPEIEATAAALRARRQALEAREQALAAREALVAATEQRIEARLAELVSLQALMERADTAARDREEAHWRSQAKLYEAMRPREAAAVFNELDLPVLVQVLQRMSERKAAPILGAMQPERVRQLTVELARLRTTPPPG